MNPSLVAITTAILLLALPAAARLDETAVQATVSSICRNPSYLTATDFVHMDNTRFAFHIPKGLVIVSYNAVLIIQKWNDEIKRQKTEATCPPKKDLSGF